MTSLEHDAYVALRDDVFALVEEVEFPRLVTVIQSFILMHDLPKPDQPRWCATCDKAWPCPPFHTLYRLISQPPP